MNIRQQLDQEIAAAYQSGATQTAIADSHGVTRRRVYGALRRAGVPRRGRGENRGPRSLVDQEGADVAELFLQGATVDIITETYGVCRATVLRCLREHSIDPPARRAPQSRYRDEQKRAMAVHRWVDGRYLKDIANCHGCSVSTAKRITDTLKTEALNGFSD